MDEQRTNQMRMINSDEQHRNYYQSFKKLWLILFQVSHYLMENMFKLSMDMYQNKKIVVICLIF